MCNEWHVRCEADELTRALTGRGNNERLEFLGDAVLQFIASVYIHARHAHAKPSRLAVCVTVAPR